MKIMIPNVDPWLLFEANSVRIIDAVRFMAPFFGAEYKGVPCFPWYNSYELLLPLKIISFTPPILAFMALMLNRKKEYLIYFAILTLISIFIVKGPNQPLGFINTFIFRNFNLYIIFRSNYQVFTPYIVLGLSVLISFTIDALMKLKIKMKTLNIINKIIIILVLISFIVIIGVLPYPLWIGSFYDPSGFIPSRRVEVPAYYFDIASWLDTQQDEFNILPLPFPTRTNMVLLWENGTKGYTGRYPFCSLSTKHFIVNEFGDSTGSNLVRLIINGYVKNASIFNLFNIKYIFLHRDANWEYISENPRWVGDDLEKIRVSINSIDGLILIKSLGNIDIYLNKYWKPFHAYILSLTAISDVLSQGNIITESFINDTSIKNIIENSECIKLDRINPTLFKARIQVTQQTLLIFNEHYDEGWLLIINNKKYTPFKIFGFGNAYLINEKENLEITLEYEPQLSFNYGCLISLASFLLFSCYIIYVNRNTICSVISTFTSYIIMFIIKIANI
jgi:hypothetical protein